ncbi:MAG: hypothetical protein IIB07_10080, partial [Bacteroidetes bacterium]|nr:hypothetical protein [Bacteroidota bacterium]
MSELIKLLNRQVGNGNYILFLTADHGVSENPDFLKQNNIPSGWVNFSVISDSLKSFSKRKFGNINILENFSNKQIFLNYSNINSLKLNLADVRKIYAEYLRSTFTFISQIFIKDFLITHVANRTSSNLILNGFNPSLSGDVAFELQPGY